MPSTSSLVERTRQRFRSRPLQAATGALALLAITYSIYTWSIGGSGRGGAANASDSRQGTDSGIDKEGSPKNAGESSRTGKSSSNQSSLNRPTLSLSFPPSFDSSNPINLSHLKLILSVLSSSFLINLIVPAPSIRSHLDPQDQIQGQEDAEDDDLFENLDISTKSKPATLPDLVSTGLSLESIERLSAELSKVELFDTRRVLEYSSDKGRAALARSLKSDAHVEVLLSSQDDTDSAARKVSDQSRREEKRSETKEIRLKEYKPLLELLRKSSGLIIFLVLPSPSFSDSTSKGQKDLSYLDLSTESILGPFGSGVHVPGIRVFDLRDRSIPGKSSSRSSNAGTPARGGEGEPFTKDGQVTFGEEDESEVMSAWREGAERVMALRKGWK